MLILNIIFLELRWGVGVGETITTHIEKGKHTVKNRIGFFYSELGPFFLVGN